MTDEFRTQHRHQGDKNNDYDKNHQEKKVNVI